MNTPEIPGMAPLERGKGSLKIRYRGSLWGFERGKPADAMVKAIPSPNPTAFKFNHLSSGRQQSSSIN